MKTATGRPRELLAIQRSLPANRFGDCTEMTSITSPRSGTRTETLTLSLPELCGIAIAMAVCCGGCGTPEHVDGRWTGVLRSVPVRDDDGRAHHAFVVDINEGPRLPYPAQAEFAGQRTAVLVHGDNTIWQRLDGLVGAGVEVKGRMTLATPRVDYSAVRLDEGGTLKPLGLAIIMRWRPKVLKQ